MEVNIDPAVAAAIWATVFVIRGLIPKGVVNLDGKMVIYGLVLVASVVWWYQNSEDNTPDDADAWIEAGLSIVTNAVGAIVINGGMSASGLGGALRKVVTVNGKANAP